MKKFLAIFMALVIFATFSFFAVGSGNKKDAEETQTQYDDYYEDDSYDEDYEKPTFEAPEPPSIKDETEPEFSGKLSRGTISGNIYKNDSIGLTFTKPNTWYYSSDEELAEILDMGSEIMNFSDLEMALAETTTIYDMAAIDTTYGTSVTICFENTILSSNRKVTEDEYLEEFKKQLLSISAEGMSYTFNGTQTATLGDTSFKRASFSLVSNGITMNQYIYVKTYDKYVATIAVTTVYEDIATIEAMFS